MNAYETAGMPNNPNNNDATQLIVENNKNNESIQIISGNRNSGDVSSSSYFSGVPSVKKKKRYRRIRYGHEG